MKLIKLVEESKQYIIVPSGDTVKLVGALEKFAKVQDIFILSVSAVVELPNQYTFGLVVGFETLKFVIPFQTIKLSEESGLDPGIIVYKLKDESRHTFVSMPLGDISLVKFG